MNDQTSSHRRILRSSSITGGSALVNIAVGLAKTKLAALWLGPAGLGLIVLLQSLMDIGPAWAVMPSCLDDPAEVFVACVQIGLEGIVAKRCTSRYRPGVRSADWVKAKSPTWREDHAGRRHEH